MDENEDFKAKSSWSASILRRGLRIGEKAAIAGAAITSAPVIIPPLFVLSTLTLVFSFPFGIYLAGYVCADKLMRVLLPLPPSTEEIDNGGLEAEDLIGVGLDSEYGDGMVLWEKNRGKSAYDLTLDSLTEEIDNGGLESEDLRDRGLDTEYGDEMVLGEKNKDKSAYDLSLDSLTEEIDNGSIESEDLIERGLDTEQDDEMVPCKKNRDKGEIDNGSMESEDLIERGLDTEQGDEIILCKKNRDKGEIDRVEEIRTGEKIGEEDKGEIDRAITEDLRKGFFPNAENENRGEEVRDDGNVSPENRGFPKSPYSVVIMAANKESDKKEYEPLNLSSEHFSIVEGKGNDIPLKKELREDNGEDVIRVANGVEVPRLKSDYVLSAVIVPSRGEDVEILEKVGSLEHRNVGKLVPAATTVGVGVTALHSHDERTHNEEQLWDQIFSIRTIVGYKATLKPSLGEEIVALYLMIGVEPPVSLKDAVDLAEISNGLQFLKYVVGVK